MINFRYITNIKENVEEGTKLTFDGGFDRVEDLDKVVNEDKHVKIRNGKIGLAESMF